jgi:hypothetical protein
MIVYRFEKNGIGPYVGGMRMSAGSFYGGIYATRTGKKYSKKFDQLVLSVDSTKRQDGWVKSHSKKEYLFGCASKETLRTYFRGNFKSLFKEGYRIKRYKVPDEEVIDMGVEVAFPVKYHKFQTIDKLKERSPFL